MERETITREEFDRRLEQSTERMRQKSTLLEARAAELEDLISRYSAVLERLEAENELKSQTPSPDRDVLRDLLRELAERTSAVASSL